MRIIFLKFFDFVNNVTSTLEGTLGSENIEIIEMKNDVLYRPLPPIYQDRENLKKDSKKVVEDLNVAYCEYEEKKILW